MYTYISMLRGINVSGQKKIKMDDLRRMYESLGFKQVKSYIQSGNIVFQSTEKDVQALQSKIREMILVRLGFDVPVIIRRPDELKKIIDENPFKQETEDDPKKRYVTFLSTQPSDIDDAMIAKAKNAHEQFQIIGREIHLFCGQGYGKTKLTNNFFEQKLKVSATSRNWRTLNQLHELACEMEGV